MAMRMSVYGTCCWVARKKGELVGRGAGWEGFETVEVRRYVGMFGLLCFCFLFLG